MDYERSHVETRFSYRDKFGNYVNLNRTSGTESIDLNPGGEFGFIIDQFKVFLRSCEFSDESIDKIQWKI